VGGRGEALTEQDGEDHDLVWSVVVWLLLLLLLLLFKGVGGGEKGGTGEYTHEPQSPADACMHQCACVRLCLPRALRLCLCEWAYLRMYVCVCA
jgi:hypothetical protein